MGLSHAACIDTCSFATIVEFAYGDSMGTHLDLCSSLQHLTYLCVTVVSMVD